jgi:NodT family efflux transporter outer membrane factor (OMF) lipoprotein
MRRGLRILVVGLLASALHGCTAVGPDFVKPDVELPGQWSVTGQSDFEPVPQAEPRWWLVFDDPVLNQLVEMAWQGNNNVEIAGLRMLEARAQLGIAEGSLYPQTQVIGGSAEYSQPADNFGGKAGWLYGIGASASWEFDFWGRYQRGIESADAAWFASAAARDQLLILLTAQVVGTYTAMRTNEEQLRIAHENVKIQQRSYDIASTLYRNGEDSELDMQQAHTLLLSTQATIPGYRVAIKQTCNALNTLLGKTPGSIEHLLPESSGIPALPAKVEVGIPADLLRRRPDIRQAEFNAMAQNALVGVATADLYPSFSLAGSLSLVSGGTSEAGFGDLFSGDALTYTIGPSFVWPFLNYGRIKNNIRVQDVRLQQALVNYRETVIQAAREVEDAMAAFVGAEAQKKILQETVTSAKRSNELSMLRYREGFSDYQRVLNSQQSLFNQQIRLVAQRGASVQSLVALYQALGGGWQGQSDGARISRQSMDQMRQRSDWNGLLDEDTEIYPDEAGGPSTKHP